MKLAFSSLYAEVGISFDISHKVDDLIKTKLNEKVMEPYSLLRKNGDTILDLCITTKSNIEHAHARGPDYDKQNNIITWALWLPYKLIIESENQIQMYVKQVLISAQNVFVGFDVPGEVVTGLEEEIMAEVNSNPSKFVYHDEGLPPPDLSDIEF